MRFQRFLFLVLFAAGAGAGWAEQTGTEPAVVPVIQKACDSIDERLVTWRTIRGEHVCVGPSCDDMTIHVDTTGRIRKIVQHTQFEGSGDSSSRGSTDYLSYLDENELPLYYYSKNVAYTRPDAAGQISEIRYYFDQGKVAAYKKDKSWMSPEETTDTGRQLIDIQLNRARQQLSNIRLYTDPTY